MKAVAELKVMKPPLNEDDYKDAAATLQCEVAAIKAVAEVESGPHGGFLPSGEPTILFERHIFRRLTNGAFDGSWPYLSNKKPGGYGAVSDQHKRLAEAVKLNREAALMACSWGRFQVLGRNWESLKYSSLQEFINCMYRSERDHLDSFVRFVEVNGLAKYLRAKQWSKFAAGYNGPGFWRNSYDAKMALAYQKHSW
jgi:hypothetical protein